MSMYVFRQYRINLLVHVNEEGVARGINPFDSGSVVHTDVMKTDQGGARLVRRGVRRRAARRRMSRAKSGSSPSEPRAAPRDPKQSAARIWRSYNARHRRGESICVVRSRIAESTSWLYIHRRGDS